MFLFFFPFSLFFLSFFVLFDRVRVIRYFSSPLISPFHSRLVLRARNGSSYKCTCLFVTFAFSRFRAAFSKPCRFFSRRKKKELNASLSLFHLPSIHSRFHSTLRILPCTPMQTYAYRQTCSIRSIIIPLLPQEIKTKVFARFSSFSLVTFFHLTRFHFA